MATGGINCLWYRGVKKRTRSGQGLVEGRQERREKSRTGGREKRWEGIGRGDREKGPSPGTRGNLLSPDSKELGPFTTAAGMTHT